MVFEARKETLSGKPADQEDGRLEPQDKNLYQGEDTRFFSRSEMAGGEEAVQSCKHLLKWASSQTQSGILWPFLLSYHPQVDRVHFKKSL